jgi:ElaB/YqjD/DUF883 family membrane-anchored ribosome-binding protein
MSSTASETGREGLVGQVASQTEDAAAKAQEKAVELKEQGRNKLSETLDRRTSHAGGQARQMAQALRGSGEQLREQGDGQVAGVTEGAAERVERLGGYLEQASGDEILRDVEDFARRRPWMVAGVGLAVGLAASRFLKASSERRYDSAPGRPYSSGYGYGTGSAGAGDYETAGESRGQH